LGTIFFFFFSFYIALFLRFYSHVAGAVSASMLWSMVHEIFKTSCGATTRCTLLFFWGFYFRSVIRLAEHSDGWDDFLSWLCKAEWWSKWEGERAQAKLEISIERECQWQAFTPSTKKTRTTVGEVAGQHSGKWRSCPRIADHTVRRWRFRAGGSAIWI